jgi:hypothetical protein
MFAGTDPDPGFDIFAIADLASGLDLSKICVFFYVKKVKKGLWIWIKMQIWIQIQGLTKICIRI